MKLISICRGSFPSRGHLYPFLFLSLLFLASCGEQGEEAERLEPGPDSMVMHQDPPMRDTGYSAENEEIFEEIVMRQYADLVGKVPPKQADSVAKEVMRRVKDPRRIKEELNSAIAAFMAEQDTIAREFLAAEYNISLDSVNAILAEENAQNVVNGQEGE